MKKLLTILSFIWLFITLTIVSVYAILPGLIILFIYGNKAYGNFLLLSIARVGQRGINFFGFIYQIIKGNKKDFTRYILNCAIVEDARTNTYNGKLFSDVLIKKESHQKFGNPLETISDNLGENQLKNWLEIDGQLLVKFLNFIDKNHTIKSIKND